MFLHLPWDCSHSCYRPCYRVSSRWTRKSEKDMNREVYVLIPTVLNFPCSHENKPRVCCLCHPCINDVVLYVMCPFSHGVTPLLHLLSTSPAFAKFTCVPLLGTPSHRHMSGIVSETTSRRRRRGPMEVVDAKEAVDLATAQTYSENVFLFVPNLIGRSDFFERSISRVYVLF